MNILTISGVVIGEPKVTEDRVIFDIFYIDKNLKFSITCVAKDTIFNHAKNTIRNKQKLFVSGEIAVKSNKIFLLLHVAEHCGGGQK